MQHPVLHQPGTPGPLRLTPQLDEWLHNCWSQDEGNSRATALSSCVDPQVSSHLQNWKVHLF